MIIICTVGRPVYRTVRNLINFRWRANCWIVIHRKLNIFANRIDYTARMANGPALVAGRGDAGQRTLLCRVGMYRRCDTRPAAHRNHLPCTRPQAPKRSATHRRSLARCYNVPDRRTNRTQRQRANEPRISCYTRRCWPLVSLCLRRHQSCYINLATCRPFHAVLLRARYSRLLAILRCVGLLEIELKRITYL